MKVRIIIGLALLITYGNLNAQSPCATYLYQQKRITANPGIETKSTLVQGFQTEGSQSGATVIRIPVVIHNLYHTPPEKITDAQVIAQLQILNACFRKQNADTVNTPAYFKSLAADVEIEFVLATSDVRKRSTSGIVRKYTPVKAWEANDKMKFAAEMGDDAWDPTQYLNIWVCNLTDFAGYASMIGDDRNKDGIVIAVSVFGPDNKTIVHEAGHWLNLKHLWGDDYCGDDAVSDTPQQASYTMGCPVGKRLTCGNATTGDMYMNYMDFTEDNCVNLFTRGQKARMRALFAGGGYRSAMLSSAGLNPPLILESPVPDADPIWLRPNLYPVPATQILTLDITYDPRWMGKNIFITNQQGQLVMTLTITSKTQQINIGRLQPGIYFLAAKKDDGESLKQKFIKL